MCGEVSGRRLCSCWPRPGPAPIAVTIAGRPWVRPVTEKINETLQAEEQSGETSWKGLDWPRLLLLSGIAASVAIAGLARSCGARTTHLRDSGRS